MSTPRLVLACALVFEVQRSKRLERSRHEAMDARTFPRLQESQDSFAGGIVDVESIFGPSINKMRALGLFEENDQWAEASERAYSMYTKRCGLVWCLLDFCACVNRAANQNVPMVSYLENYRRDAAVSGCKTQTF